MNPRIPKVSVIIPTYNHGKFVDECLGSVLDQRDVDFEVLIADDGSHDDTVVRLAKWKDPRIRFWAHDVNRGAAVVVNELLRFTNGNYIALINSDDSWPRSDKLARQCELLDANKDWGAVFGRPEFIGSDNAALKTSDNGLSGLFRQSNRSQAEWLRFFFEYGNCLCHPTILIRRHCYEELGGYNNRFRQLPDFEMWVRLIKRYRIHVADDVWVRFRVLPGQNASSPTFSNCVRDINEHLLLREHFLSDVSSEMLQVAFADCFPKGIDWADDAHLAVARVWPLLKVKNGPYKRVCRIIGLMKLRHMLDNQRCRSILESNYGFDDRTFHQLMSEEDCLLDRIAHKKNCGFFGRWKNVMRCFSRNHAA